MLVPVLALVLTFCRHWRILVILCRCSSWLCWCWCLLLSLLASLLMSFIPSSLQKFWCFLHKLIVGLAVTGSNLLKPKRSKQQYSATYSSNISMILFSTRLLTPPLLRLPSRQPCRAMPPFLQPQVLRGTTNLCPSIGGHR